MIPRRILFATVPFDGHVSPLTGLAVHLHQTGHDVRWYVGGHYGKQIKKLGLPHYPHVNAPVINQENMDELFPERKRIKSPLARVRFDIRQTFLTPVSELRRRLPGYPCRLAARGRYAGPATQAARSCSGCARR